MITLLNLENLEKNRCQSHYLKFNLVGKKEEKEKLENINLEHLIVSFLIDKKYKGGINPLFYLIPLRTTTPILPSLIVIPKPN